jgi:uncharacterized membrane protein SpoIIM required for sporulation
VNEIEFEARHSPEWAELHAAVAPARKGAAPGAAPAAEVPRRFRRVVAQLALARDRQYRTSLLDRLHALVTSAHLAVHGAHARRGRGIWAELRRFVLETFPRSVRSEWPFVLGAGVAFFGPLLAILAAILWHPDFVYYLVSPETLSMVQSMYAPGNDRIGAGREADTDLAMFGFYIANNVRIDLQCLAGGIFFGLGSLFFLVFNGLFIGAIAGHLTGIGYGATFWGFVSGHSAFELIGAVLAGAAGLRIGHALVAPGRRTRGAALRAAGRPAAMLIYGAAMLTTAAAVIEAFWSSRVSIPLEIKVAFGLAMWAVTVVYLAFGGRSRGA